MIHCIGDSHSSVFSGKEEIQPIWPNLSDDQMDQFKSYRIGAATAYQLHTKVPIINNIIESKVKKNDKVLFCFGEVDIRAHLIKQKDLQSREIQDIVKECVDRYMIVLKNYKYQNIDMYAWGPIASWHPSRQYTGGPSFGSCYERNLTTKYFNEYLNSECIKNNIGFVSIFDKMVDKDLITIPTYLDDWEGCHMHLSQRAMPLILNEFKNQDLI
jgi:hypothetical protein